MLMMHNRNGYHSNNKHVVNDHHKPPPKPPKPQTKPLQRSKPKPPPPPRQQLNNIHPSIPTPPTPKPPSVPTKIPINSSYYNSNKKPKGNINRNSNMKSTKHRKSKSSPSMNLAKILNSTVNSQHFHIKPTKISQSTSKSSQSQCSSPISSPPPLISISKSKSSAASKSSLILCSKPMIPTHSHYHRHKQQEQDRKRSNHRKTKSNTATSNSLNDIDDNMKYYSTNHIDQHSLNVLDIEYHEYDDDDNDDDTKISTSSRRERISTGGSSSNNDCIAPLSTPSIATQIFSKKHSIKRERRFVHKERRYSGVHEAFSLKRGRLDSSMQSMHKLSIDDQRVLQRDEWKLMNALKSHNKDVIINAIKNCKMEVLCNFLSFICLMLNNVAYNVYNIHSMKDDIIIILKDIIDQSLDLQQHLTFICNCYPNIKSLFGDRFNKNGHNNNNLMKTFLYKTTDHDNCDAVSFWNDIINEESIYEGMNIKIVKQNDKFKKYVNKHIVDPIIVEQGSIQLIAIRKILNSNAKPLLLDIYVKDENENHNFQYISYFKYNKLCNGVLSSTTILKKGDDLRKDAMCMLVFKFMNQLFFNKNINYKGKVINILTYKVVPISNELGCIELIADCIGLRDINLIKEFLLTDNMEYEDDIYLNNLIASSAAAYISCLILGIRDRHYDNQMIRKIDYKLFHIDFNFMFGEKASLDASELGITKQLAQIMNDKYKIFVELAIEAHQILRNNNKQLIDFITMAFSTLYQPKIIHQYISKKLRLKLNDDKSKNWLRKKLLKAPQNTQTKLKNTIHKIAVNLHSTNNNKEWD